MSHIALLDLCTVVVLMGASLALISAKRAFSGHGHIRGIVLWLLFFLILHFSALFIEWKDSDTVFDVLEDFLGTLIPMWWAFLFYGMSQEISNFDLRRSKEQFQQFIENQPVGMFRSLLEGDGRLLMVNPALVEMSGYENAEELMGQPVASLYKDPEQRKHVMAELKEKGVVYAYDIEVVKKDGAVLYGSLTLRLVNDPEEGPTQVDGTLLDISKRKKAERELLKSEHLHREAQRVAKLGHWDHEVGNDRIAWSEEMYRIFELDPEKISLSLKSFLPMVHPDDRKLFVAAAREAVQNGSEIDMVHRILLPDGRTKYIHAIGHVESDAAGKPAKLFGTVQDITPLKEAEIEKAKAEKMLQEARKLEAIGRLAGGIAHDFNNILAPMMGYTEMAIRDLPENSPAAENLHEVVQAGLRARDLVSQILTFSREAKTVPQPVRVEEIIHEVVKLFRSTLPSNIEIFQEISGPCPPISAEPTQVHQIIMNLCKNASQAIGNNGGRITITLHEVAAGPGESHQGVNLSPGRHLHLVVADTGGGMAKEVADQIFDPYFTTKKKGDGTGLGLAIVHGIIKKYQGHISVTSEPGRGTSFSIHLPCVAERPQDLQGPSLHS